MRKAMLLPGCAALVLSACTNHIGTQIGSTPALVTDADVRVITDRPSPFEPNNPARRAVCTEPSPDVAKALATALTLSASASVPGGPTGSGSLNSQTAEGILELAGRVPAVVALRDGTYQLCQAWTNGAVGNSAYALTLGRYDQLLVTLMLGEDMVASSRPAPGQLIVSVTPAPPSPPPAPKGAGTAAPQTTSQLLPGTAATQLVRDSSHDSTNPVRLASLGPMFVAVADAAKPTDPAGAAGAAPGPVAADKGSPQPTPKPAPAPPSPKPPAETTPPDTGTAAIAQALVQIHKDYMTLGGVGPLLAACIAAWDTTTPVHANGPDSPVNPLLSLSFCQQVLGEYAGTVSQLMKSPAPQGSPKP